MEHFNLELADGFATFFNCTANFRQKVYWRRLGFCEDVYMVGSHTLLSDEHLFGPVDNEITPRIVGAFIQIVQILVLQTSKNTEGRTQHNGDLANN
jgi:hypothetical protein